MSHLLPSLRSWQQPLISVSRLRHISNIPRKSCSARTTSTPKRFLASSSVTMNGHGDINNIHASRPSVAIAPDEAYIGRSLAIRPEEDDPDISARYRPFLVAESVPKADDWVEQLELSTAMRMVDNEIFQQGAPRPRILVLYGSLRERSFSRLLAFEGARILHRLGCDVRVYDPTGLPLKDDVNHEHPKVQELRTLSAWSDGHFWVSPEQHGAMTGIFKMQIDWIPLSAGSVRPTQGRTLAIAQVSGGSQSFNAVNTLRLLGRWMRMFVIPNQSSVPMAYTQFTPADDKSGGGSRMMPSSNRDRLVDCMEELVKYTVVMRPHFDLFGDRYSEREEKRKKAAKA